MPKEPKFAFTKKALKSVAHRPFHGPLEPHKHMIFWAWDQYPFTHWAPGFMVDDERAWIPSQQTYVNPIEIWPMHVGRAIGRQLDMLTTLRERTLAFMESEFSALLNEAKAGCLPLVNPPTPKNFKNHPLRQLRKWRNLPQP